MDSQAVLNYMVQRYGSADWSKYEAVRWSWYDYVRYPVAGTNSLGLFVNPAGSVDPVSTLQKTLEQTNLVKAGSFGQQYFMLLQVKTHLSLLPKARQAAAIAALTRYTLDNGQIAFWDSFADLAQNGVLRLYIQQKEYLQLAQPFINAPPGFGLAIDRAAFTTAGAAVNNVAYWCQQGPHRADVFSTTPPLLIEPEVQFRLNIEFPQGVQALAQIAANNVALDVGVWFDGYVIRPAQ